MTLLIATYIIASIVLITGIVLAIINHYSKSYSDDPLATALLFFSIIYLMIVGLTQATRAKDFDKFQARYDHYTEIYPEFKTNDCFGSQTIVDRVVSINETILTHQRGINGVFVSFYDPRWADLTLIK